MDDRFSLIILISLVGFVPSAMCLCDFEPLYFINETANGTIILSANKPAGSNVLVRVEDSSKKSTFEQELESLLLIRNYNTSFTLENTEPLDLERFYWDYQRDITNVNLKITCDGIENSMTLSVLPVNEFDPVFANSPYNITIPESTAVNTTVFQLKPKVIDRDVGTVQNFYFHIHPYNIQSFDGKEYFIIYASSRGNIDLKKALDYDIPNNRNIFRLNVSVADGQTGFFRRSFTDVTVQVEDVDDQVPYFRFPNCPKPCPAPPFEATTWLDYTGKLQTLPNDLQAIDDDTLRTPLLYSIQSGNQHNMFEINQTTGVINQKTSVNSLNIPDAEFRLVIEVRKNLTNVDLSSIAILTIHVWERMSNASGYPEPPVSQSKEGESGSDLMIPLIVLGVFLAIVLVALVLVFIIYRRKQREMAVRPADEKSEPQTEEEDLHTEGEDYTARCDSNEKLVYGNKTTLGIMTEDFPNTAGEKASRLPPLPMRDTATETTEGKRKKKARRRNKKKDPEIFDGTREYNMGADPEFFDSTDKSRVKRSQRSRKADPALPIQVPNDNPTDEESVYM